LRVVFNSFFHAFLPILTPAILLGGIWSGFFTPTEAAAVAVAYTLALGLFVYREISPRDLVEVFVSTAKETAAICFIVCAASFYGWMLMRSGITLKLAAAIAGVSTDRIVILLLMNGFLLVIGCFLEPVVAILILGPVLLPVITKIGIDPLHFGVVMVLNLMIGLLTPPFGIVLFVMAGISELSFENVVRVTLPFLAPLLVVLLLITFFPSIVTALPNLLIPG
jgi:tripartite ATP-independent transporter DctM subunit